METYCRKRAPVRKYRLCSQTQSKRWKDPSQVVCLAWTFGKDIFIYSFMGLCLVWQRFNIPPPCWSCLGIFRSWTAVKLITSASIKGSSTTKLNTSVFEQTRQASWWSWSVKQSVNQQVKMNHKYIVALALVLIVACTFSEGKSTSVLCPRNNPVLGADKSI